MKTHSKGEDMRPENDPNPLPLFYKCVSSGCAGTVIYGDDENAYRCEECDFTITYDKMKGEDLFGRYLVDHYNWTIPQMQAILRLNEQYDNGKGLSEEEYNRKLEEILKE